MKKLLWVIGLLVSILLFVAALFVFFPNLIPPHLREDYSSRIGIAQLAIEISSLLALGLAVLEFRQAQKKPKLKLWLRPRDQKILFDGKEEILISDKSAPLINAGSGPTISGEFTIFLENSGEAIARWPRISLTILEEFQGENFLLSIRENTGDHWKGVREGFGSRHGEFYGGDDFVCYSHPSKNHTEKSVYSEEIGQFWIAATGINTPPTRNIHVLCSIEAYDFPRREQVFTFRPLLN